MTLALATGLLTTPAFATVEGNGYTFAGGKLTITSYAGTTAWRTDNGIAEPDKDRYNAIKEVEIQSGVTTIGNYAFQNCTNLEKVTLPDSITTIGMYAFYNCADLALEALPDGVTSIGDSAFSGCSSLTTLDLSKCIGLTTIGTSAFRSCAMLTQMTLPDSIKTIGTYAFSDCTNLTRLTFSGNQAPALGNSAFSRSDNLVIYVPKGATGYDEGEWANHSSRLVSGAALFGLEVAGGTVDPAFFPGKTDYSLYISTGESETITM